MTFEEILPALKAGQKAVRTVGWGSSEEYIFVVKDEGWLKIGERTA